MQHEIENKELRYYISMMAIINKLIERFTTKAKPVYGSKIFTQRSWLSKQIDDAIYEREMLRGTSLPKRPLPKA